MQAGKLKEGPGSEPICKDWEVLAFKEISVKALAECKLRNRDFNDHIDKEYSLQ